MARGKAVDQATLEMALIGYEIEKEKIDAKIKEIRGRLGKRPGRPPGASSAKEAAAPKKRVLSAAARKRIAAAQRKRWAEHRRKQAQAQKA